MQFVIQADTHIDNMTNTNVLHRTIENILSVNPSFVMDLGDTLMLERYGLTESGLKTDWSNYHHISPCSTKFPFVLSMEIMMVKQAFAPDFSVSRKLYETRFVQCLSRIRLPFQET